MIAISAPLSASRVQPVHQPNINLPIGFEIHNDSLFYQNIDLLSLLERPLNVQGRFAKLTTPMYMRWLPALRHNYQQLNHWFEVAKTRTGFQGTLKVAYASKANPAEPVVRTLLQEGAAYECSSSFDVELVRQAAGRGWLDTNRTILANGFKIPAYTRNLLHLRAEGYEHILPIFDDLDEIEAFAESGFSFEVGLRSRTNCSGVNRFGMGFEELEQAAQIIAATDNLHLTTFHAMQTIPASRGLQYHAAMMHSLRTYAALWRVAPSLHRFNLGGGLPGISSGMDFQDWMNQTLQMIIAICDEESIPQPDLMIESGRYLVQDHACKMFRVLKSKAADDGVPFYMIDGSIMSNFPDAWALGDQFTVLPINHWDSPFGLARLAGLTCDPDDVYPTRKMGDMLLELPVDTDDLVVGFFDCGAYQETLSGRHGAKHCLLPEGPDLILDQDADHNITYSYQCAQTAEDVLDSLGYNCRPS